MVKIKRMMRICILSAGGILILALGVESSRPPYPVPSGEAREAAPVVRTFSVKEFGAKGDGVTDDSAVVFNALTAAKRAGGRVFFPPGTYLLNAPQGGPPNNRSVEFLAGLNNTEISGAGSASIIETTLKNICTFEFVTPSHLLVHDLKFVGMNGPNPSNGSNTCGANIRLDGATSSQVYRNEFAGTSNAGVWLSGALPGSPGSRENIVRDNYFHDSAVSAVWEDDCNNSDDSASCVSPADSPPFGNRIVHNLAVRVGSQLSGGVISVDSGANSTRTEVSNNYVEGGSGAGSGWQPNGIQATQRFVHRD